MISIIIPNYNHGRFLTERIESVLNQSFTDFECIILDDASTDNSKEIIETFAARDSRIKFHLSQSNSGSPFVQWNKGVKLAKNELIWIAESDDSCDTKLLESLVNINLQNPAVGLAYCQSLKIDEAGNFTGSWKEYTDDLDKVLFNQNFVMDGMEFISGFLIHKNVIPNASAVLFKKSVFEKVGMANELLATNSDWLTWLKMCLNHKVAFVAHPHNKFRIHADSVIAKHSSSVGHNYKDQYDGTMRQYFKIWCKQQQINLSNKILLVNQQYISYDIGNKGLHLFRNGKWIQGLKEIVKVSVFPRVTMGYIRRMIREENT